MMTSLLCFSLCLLLCLVAKPALTLTLTSSCSFSVDMLELRTYHFEIRSIIDDPEIGVIVLNKAKLDEVQDDQTCCFLRLLLHFYVDRVFRNFASDQPQVKRNISVLGNKFVTMIRNINKCHCLCNEDTQRVVDSLKMEFDQLSIDKAAMKAVAELDILLDWLSKVDQATPTE
ncbi:interleukin 19 like [Vanacampus margaritifer]